MPVRDLASVLDFEGNLAVDFEHAQLSVQPRPALRQDFAQNWAPVHWFVEPHPISNRLPRITVEVTYPATVVDISLRPSLNRETRVLTRARRAPQRPRTWKLELRLELKEDWGLEALVGDSALRSPDFGALQ
jgi:hypothetical protein